MRKNKRVAAALEAIENLQASEAGIVTAADCPEFLDENARQEFSRIEADFQEAGIPPSIYRAPLSVYANSWARWLHAEQQVRQTGGEVVKSPSGFPIANPWLAVAHQAQGQMQRVSKSFSRR